MSGSGQFAGANRVAALDLGSNSFHLLVAAVDEHGWRPQLRLGEKVQLAAGLQEGYLNLSAIERGLECLRRFAPHIRDLPPGQLRVVATHTLRVARNREQFVGPAQRIIGQTLEVISGEEEAALVYRGVADRTVQQPQLVIDVGGGSTELALGCAGTLWQLASAPLGCVTQRCHFPQGRLDAGNFERAHSAAVETLRRHWQTALSPQVQVLGSSGTLQSMEQVLLRQGWSSGGIQRPGLLRLREALLNFSHVDAVEFPGLSESRRCVFATGLAITLALFDTLAIDNMTLSQAALREGVVNELLSRGPLPGAALGA